MLCIPCLTGTYSANKCLTFQGIETQIQNNCSFVNNHEQLFNETYDKSCLVCTIYDIDQVPKSSCQKSLICIKLFFDHNFMFEQFFEKYHHIIEDLYINDRNHVLNSTLFVYIERFNWTEINFTYLNSILNINSQPYNTLIIKVSQYTEELKPLTIVGNFSLMTIRDVIITIPCNTYNQTIDYQIHAGKITSTKSVACKMSQSTDRKANPLTPSRISQTMEITTSNSKPVKIGRNDTLPTSTTAIILIATTTETTPILMVTFSLKTTESSKTRIILHTSTNITTSLSSQSSSSVLFLLSVSFVIMICIIIASIWGFLRQNNSDSHHDIGDERLNGMYHMIHADKHGITDKDSKSAASWKHGSTLLLSPLVK